MRDEQSREKATGGIARTGAGDQNRRHQLPELHLPMFAVSARVCLCAQAAQPRFE